MGCWVGTVGPVAAGVGPVVMVGAAEGVGGSTDAGAVGGAEEVAAWVPVAPGPALGVHAAANRARTSSVVIRAAPW